MKISPITNDSNQNRNISSKGYVSNTVIKDLGKCSQALEYRLNLAKTNPNKYPTIISFLESRLSFDSKYAQNIIQNLNTIMSRFGKSCELTLKRSKKNPDKKLFVIESKYSNYKHICGEIEYKYNADALANIDKFSIENLAKINPYETNLKFMQMYAPKSLTDADNFSAEKEIWFIEDELIDAEANSVTNTGKSWSWEEMKEFSDKLKKENDDFIKEFENK